MYIHIDVQSHMRRFVSMFTHGDGDACTCTCTQTYSIHGLARYRQTVHMAFGPTPLIEWLPRVSIVGCIVKQEGRGIHKVVSRIVIFVKGFGPEFEPLSVRYEVWALVCSWRRRLDVKDSKFTVHTQGL